MAIAIFRLEDGPEADRLRAAPKYPLTIVVNKAIKPSNYDAIADLAYANRLGIVSLLPGQVWTLHASGHPEAPTLARYRVEAAGMARLDSAEPAPEDDGPATLGETLRRWRASSGVTLSQLDAAGLARSHWKKVVAGRTTPSFDLVLRVATYARDHARLDGPDDPPCPATRRLIRLAELFKPSPKVAVDP